MRTAILTIGPRGAGKSTWCARVIAAHPEVGLVSRDAILQQLFGETSLDPYDVGYHVTYQQKMWDEVAEQLRADERILILDCWNGWADARAQITDHLRRLGADQVIGWQFTTSLEDCLAWYLRREEITDQTSWRYRLTLRNYPNDYCLYWRQPVASHQGFDFICPIDPRQLILPHMSYLCGP